MVGAQVLGVLSGVESARKSLVDRLPAIFKHCDHCLDLSVCLLFSIIFSQLLTDYAEMSVCSLLSGITQLVRNAAEAFAGIVEDQQLVSLFRETRKN